MKKYFIVFIGVVISFGFTGINKNAQEEQLHLKIGDKYGGGIVFFVVEKGAHGLIAAPEDQDKGLRWYGGINFNTKDGVGAGRKNTNRIARVKGTVPDIALAAKLCKEYTLEEGIYKYTDWYLPSKLELSLLFAQKDVVGGFSNTYYWSSTVYKSDITWFQDFGNGRQDVNISMPNSVRAIRSF